MCLKSLSEWIFLSLTLHPCLATAYSFLKSLAKMAKHFNIIQKTIAPSRIPLPSRLQYQSKEPSSPPALSAAAVPTELFAEDYWHCTANINQLLFCLHTQTARRNACNSGNNNSESNDILLYLLHIKWVCIDGWDCFETYATTFKNGVIIYISDTQRWWV